MPGEPDSDWETVSHLAEPSSTSAKAKAKSSTSRRLARLATPTANSSSPSTATNPGSISININLSAPHLQGPTLPTSYCPAAYPASSKAPPPTLASYSATLQGRLGPVSQVLPPSSATPPLHNPFPPAASRNGRCYYVFFKLSPPLIAAGQDVALALLGGRWDSTGTRPKGFASLEDALNFLAAVTGRNQASIVWN